MKNNKTEPVEVKSGKKSGRKEVGNIMNESDGKLFVCLSQLKRVVLAPNEENTGSEHDSGRN